jgi:hypothetical protein
MFVQDQVMHNKVKIVKIRIISKRLIIRLFWGISFVHLSEIPGVP